MKIQIKLSKSGKFIEVWIDGEVFDSFLNTHGARTDTWIEIQAKVKAEDVVIWDRAKALNAAYGWIVDDADGYDTEQMIDYIESVLKEGK